MKTKDLDKKHPFWECPNCKKEHKIKTLFCDGCGGQRPEKYSFKHNFQKTENLTNIKLFDWIIIIAAFCIPLLCLVYVANNIFFKWLLWPPVVLIIIALIRLFVCRYIFLWQRFIVLGISILFNPITLIFISLLILPCFDPHGCMSETRRTNKSKFAKACSEIVLNKNLYNTEYSNDFSDLPGFIKCTKPIYVWISEKHIKIAISQRPSYGWKFSQNTNDVWSLYSYFENELNLLKSDIIINTNNGKVTIPWSFFN